MKRLGSLIAALALVLLVTVTSGCGSDCGVKKVKPPVTTPPVTAPPVFNPPPVNPSPTPGGNQAQTG